MSLKSLIQQLDADGHRAELLTPRAALTPDGGCTTGTEFFARTAPRTSQFAGTK